MTNNSNITSLEDILDLKYGPRGTEARENWEQRYEAFKIAPTPLTKQQMSSSHS